MVTVARTTASEVKQTGGKSATAPPRRRPGGWGGQGELAASPGVSRGDRRPQAGSRECPAAARSVGQAPLSGSPDGHAGTQSSPRRSVSSSRRDRGHPFAGTFVTYHHKPRGSKQQNFLPRSGGQKLETDALRSRPPGAEGSRPWRLPHFWGPPATCVAGLPLHPSISCLPLHITFSSSASLCQCISNLPPFPFRRRPLIRFRERPPSEDPSLHLQRPRFQIRSQSQTPGLAATRLFQSERRSEGRLPSGFP